MKTKILFVCVENSCRSQMAEGFAKYLGSDILEAWSAGSNPSGKVNAKAIEFMKEKGIDLGTHSPKGLTDIPQIKWDYVITMGCGDKCPFVSSKNRVDWPIPDPKDMPAAEFRRVCDMIEFKVIELIRKISN
jgi:arsenate reductase